MRHNHPRYVVFLVDYVCSTWHQRTNASSWVSSWSSMYSKHPNESGTAFNETVTFILWPCCRPRNIVVIIIITIFNKTYYINFMKYNIYLYIFGRYFVPYIKRALKVTYLLRNTEKMNIYFSQMVRHFNDIKY